MVVWLLRSFAAVMFCCWCFAGGVSGVVLWGFGVGVCVVICWCFGGVCFVMFCCRCFGA